jgi:hypothetical protein
MDRRSWIAGLTVGALVASAATGAAGWWAVGRLGPDPGGQVRRVIDRLDGDRRAVEVERDVLRRQLAKTKFAEGAGAADADRIPPQKLPVTPGGE